VGFAGEGLQCGAPIISLHRCSFAETFSCQVSSQDVRAASVPELNVPGFGERVGESPDEPGPPH